VRAGRLVACAVVGTMATTIMAATDSVATCDSACMVSFLDTYMKAMVAHDPKSVHFAHDVRITQNAAPLQPGDGIWETLSRLSDYSVYVAEPETGAVAVISSVEENGTPELQMTRLKIDAARRVAESETLIARNGEGQRVLAPPAEDIRPAFREGVPVPERASREELVASVDKYFDAIERSDGRVVAFADDGFRIENGVRTCNDPHRVLSPTQDPMWGRLAKLTCAQGLSSGAFSYIKSITPRRYPVVDREHGLVLALIRFNHPGNILHPQVRGARGEVLGEIDMSKNEWASHPTSALIAELFKVRKGQITRVFAVIVREPYRIPTGWDR
jgi:hypothetical protein